MPAGKIVAIMPLYTALILLLLVATIPVADQTAAPKAIKAIDSLEDIEIGMSADHVIAGLTKQGYALVDAYKITGAPRVDEAKWDVSLNDKDIGDFYVEHGLVTSVEVQVYAGQDDGAIGLGEALYWILYDNGKVLPSTHGDWKETVTDVHFTTREIEERTPGLSERMIFAHMENGASYRIDMERIEKKNYVFVTKLAPFVKKK